MYYELNICIPTVKAYRSMFISRMITINAEVNELTTQTKV